MKGKSLYISLVIGLIFCGVGLSLQNPSVGNPIGSGTVPPTAYRPGLVPSANPIDTSGNLVVTGNVANGMQFRGIVPYNNPTSFSTPATSVQHTSGSLDSFLSNSTGSQSFAPINNTGRLTPYYSPMLSVTTTQPGGRGAYGPASPDVSGSNLPIGTTITGGPTGYSQNRYVSQLGQRPLSMSQQDLEKLVEANIAKAPLEGNAETQAQEQFWNSMGVRIERKAEQPNPAPVTGNENGLEKLLGINIPKANEAGAEPQTKKEGLQWQNTYLAKPGQTTDIFEQMKKQFAKPSEPAVGKPKEGLELPGEAGKTLVLPKGEVNEPKQGVTPAEFAKVYKSFVAYSNDKFNQHMRAAEDFMKQGRFYRAADAYTLASIFKPEDPLGYAGKSLALFGSGEYLSSSLFLARTLEIFPEYAKVRVDIVGMIGDKDTVENRILEARDWMEKSDSGELEFLLSYIYCQMDRLEFARQSIEAAVQKMPNSPAVAAMKKAIDERLAKP